MNKVQKDSIMNKTNSNKTTKFQFHLQCNTTDWFCAHFTFTSFLYNIHMLRTLPCSIRYIRLLMWCVLVWYTVAVIEYNELGWFWSRLASCFQVVMALRREVNVLSFCPFVSTEKNIVVRINAVVDVSCRNFKFKFQDYCNIWLAWVVFFLH